jgi:hypothetical protein
LAFFDRTRNYQFEKRLKNNIFVIQKTTNYEKYISLFNDDFFIIAFY